MKRRAWRGLLGALVLFGVAVAVQADGRRRAFARNASGINAAVASFDPSVESTSGSSSD
jgi:hypothetical protein